MSARVARQRSCKKRSYSPECLSTEYVASPKRKSKTRKTTEPDVVNKPSCPEEKAGSVKRETRRRSRKAPLTEIDSNGAVKANAIVIRDTSQESAGDRSVQQSPSEYVHRDTWPLKYSPSSHHKFIGNTAAFEQLKGWLLDWKDPIKRNPMRDASESNSSTASFASDSPSNVAFIHGPPGVGKTSLVYYLANQLGYKVLEMNASSERPGRRVLADLLEATQSRHVEGTKVSTGLSSFFKPTLTSNTPTVTTPKAKGKRQTAKAKLQGTPTGLKKFFSPISATRSPETPASQTPDVQQANSDAGGTPKSSIKSFFSRVAKDDSVSPEIETFQPKKIDSEAGEGQQIKCSSSTIILFDDVDVVFDDEGDEGFWMAMETVIKSSKKPCILTATRGYSSVLKRCRLLQAAPLIELHRPSPTHVSKLIKEICVLEDRDLTDYNVDFMCQYLSSDVRRSLLQIEFETVSSGLLQTVYPADKTFSGLVTSGYLDDAMAIHSSFRRVGFNTAYASLEECLPFEFDKITVAGPSETSECLKVSRKERDTLRDLSDVFENFAVSDMFTGCLDRMGEECLPSYERAKRWMEHRPMEGRDCNSRSVEELIELSTRTLIGSVSNKLNAIADRYSESDSPLRLPSVVNHQGFHEIHKQLKKLRLSDKTMEDVLEHVPVRRSVSFDYLYALREMCVAEAERETAEEGMGRRRKRFFHYLVQNGLFVDSQRLRRLLTFWQ